MRQLLIILFLSIFNMVYAQNGYIITKENIKIDGYLKYQRNHLDGHLEIELWKTKKDKKPERYPTSKLKEYAIKKDTIRIFTGSYLFDKNQTYIPYIELKVVQRGKLNLYSNYQMKGGNMSMPGPQGGTITYSAPEITYIIEDESGLVVLNRKNMREELEYFFDYDKYTRMLTNKKFNYNMIPDLVKLYNSR